VNRRDFITLLGGAAAATPLAARAQQGALPLIGFVSGSSPEMAGGRPAAFRKGLGESGLVEGQNVAVEYHWLDGRYEQVSALMADFVRRRVALIAVPGGPAQVALAAKAATTSIPIAFGVPEDPVKLGLVASLARPGGNATGVNFFSGEILGKRLGLLHELLPKAARIALLINPVNRSSTETALRETRDAARIIGVELPVLEAGNADEIDAAFATAKRERADVVFVALDAFLTARRLQLALLSVHYGIPTAFGGRESVEAGGLVSYGTDIVDAYRQVGVYAGRILKGAKPADLPVEQATKFELVINLIAAKLLGVEVPSSLLARADGVIE
jgi:putative ABC transport system substrate-binding protein